MDSESIRNFHKLRLDALSIPNYVIKNGRSHGARHGKTEAQREHHLALNAWQRCCNKVDSQGEHFTGIRDRFLIDPVNSQSDGQNESAKSGMNLQKKTIHIISLQRKRKDTKDKWYLTLNKAGKNGPLKLRSDFRAVVSMKNRPHNESGEQIEERLHPDQQRRWHSSSSTSWCDKSEWNWK